MNINKDSEKSATTIVIAEDSPTQAEQLKYVLEKNKYRIILAKNGKEALQSVIEFKPALVISDIIMPEMDGYELCRTIKANADIYDIPVILLTSLSHPDDVLEGISCGADNFLTKPYSDEYLLSHIEHILSNKRINRGERVRVGIEILFAGKRRFITSDQQQMLSLLLSTYEAAVCKNKELAVTQEKLELLNEHLEELVEKRTGELSAENANRKLAEESVKKLNRVYSLLSNINQTIVRVKDEQFLFDEACRIAIGEGKFLMALIAMRDLQTNKVSLASSAGFEHEYLENLRIDLNEDFLQQEITGRAILSGLMCIANDIANNPDMISCRENALRYGYKSSAAFPLVVFGKSIGAITLYSDEQSFFDEAEVRLLVEMAMDISFSIEFVENENKRKHNEAELRKSEERYRSTLDNMMEGCQIIDYDWQYIYINDVAVKHNHRSKEELLGKSFLEMRSGEEESDVIKIAKECMVERTPQFVENEQTFNDGTKGWFELRIAPVPEGIFILSVDISERKQLEASVNERTKELEKANNELKAAKEKAEEINRLKSNFLANMSHELRTPLIGITGYADFLQQDIKDPEQKEMAEIIFQSGNRLSETINLILDLSKYESEKIDFNYQNIDIVDETKDIIGKFIGSAHKKGLDIESSFSQSTIYLSTDEMAFRSVLNNLINNAIKYTYEGLISVDVSQNNDFVELKVTDTGIGIPKEAHDLVFDEFRQVSEGLSRNFEGTGLGLNITKRIVEKFNGEISVESQTGQGAIFTVKLPRKRKEKVIEQETVFDKTIQAAAPEQKTEMPNGLIVDDDPFVYPLMKRYIALKVNLEDAKDGKTAINLCLRKQYDIIFMDINLRHGQDGKEVTKAIRKIKGYENIPIIATTAYAMAGDREEFLAAGCSHYLSKPFNQKTALSLLGEIFGEK